jgi:hypothetical protein
VLGALVIEFTAKNGIDMTFMLKDRFEDFGFGSVVYPVMNVRMFMEIALLVAVAGTPSAVYPARKVVVEQSRR